MFEMELKLYFNETIIRYKLETHHFGAQRFVDIQLNVVNSISGADIFAVTHIFIFRSKK